ncbi:MAG: hypothetical protein P8Y70_11860, partial [Candidatus Lokiarchaeota archaeon]
MNKKRQRRAYIYEDFANFAKNNEGKLLTTKLEFDNLRRNTAPTRMKLKWKCDIEFHGPWIAMAKDVLGGTWCPECFQERNRKYTYLKCKKLIEEKGFKENGTKGQLLTSKGEFKNMKQIPSHRKLKWYCGLEGHRPWIATPNSLDQGKWCPTCRRKRKWTYNDCVELAKNQGLIENKREGKLLTKKEQFNKINGAKGHSKLKWWCGGEDHQPWYAPPNNIDQGHWCPDCANNRRLTYQDMITLAERRGKEENGIKGQLITTEEEFTPKTLKNKPSQVNLKWWCGKRDHEPWIAKYNWIQQGSWCPQCSNSKGENICRWYFEKIFKKTFPTTQLSDLFDDYNGRLHLDGYAEILINRVIYKVAFEFNGQQHYEFPNFFHKSLEEFKAQVQNDKIKKQLCKDANMILIEVPYWVNVKMNIPT